MKIETTLVTFTDNNMMASIDTIFIGGKPYAVVEWDAEDNPVKTVPLDPTHLSPISRNNGADYLYDLPITLPD